MKPEDFTEEELVEIQEAMTQIERGEFTVINSQEDLINYLDSL